MLIHGTTVRLYEKVESGARDAFNRPITESVPIDIENVLIEPLSETEVLDLLNLTGRKAVYRLHIPKGDAHVWTDCRVDFFGKSWHVIGDVLEFQEELVPLSWNKRIRVERIDG